MFRIHTGTYVPFYTIMMKTILKKVSRAAKDLCFPPACLCCKKSLEDSRLLLCGACFWQLEFTQSPFCPCCGKVFPGGGENHLCGVCLKSPWSFHQVRSLLVYEETLACLVHGLKYSGKTAGLETFKKLAQYSRIRFLGADHVRKFQSITNMGGNFLDQLSKNLKTGSAILADLVEPDFILPVPLHPKRLRKRGFNQALL